MTTTLHQERLDAVVQALRETRASSVIDLGCGHGELLLRLRQQGQFVRLLGIDIDQHALALARSILGIDWMKPDGRLEVRYGSFEEMDSDLRGFDAAIMLETIEHIDPGRLSKVERAVFVGMQPAHVLITTPNQEYNVLHGMAPGQRRHPGHRFEWTRAQFRHWCSGVAGRYNYTVTFADLGTVDPLCGSSSQMAHFIQTPKMTARS